MALKLYNLATAKYLPTLNGAQTFQPGNGAISANFKWRSNFTVWQRRNFCQLQMALKFSSLATVKFLPTSNGAQILQTGNGAISANFRWRSNFPVWQRRNFCQLQMALKLSNLAAAKYLPTLNGAQTLQSGVKISANLKWRSNFLIWQRRNFCQLQMALKLSNLAAAQFLPTLNGAQTFQSGSGAISANFKWRSNFPIWQRRNFCQLQMALKFSSLATKYLPTPDTRIFLSL